MEITKRVYGFEIILELEKIKDYGNYTLYQVYRVNKNNRVPIYKECFTDLQLEKIIRNKYEITEEIFL